MAALGGSLSGLAIIIIPEVLYQKRLHPAACSDHA